MDLESWKLGEFTDEVCEETWLEIVIPMMQEFLFSYGKQLLEEDDELYQECLEGLKDCVFKYHKLCLGA